MTRGRRARMLAGALAVVLAASAAALPAGAAVTPYDQRWRIQSEVGGDIGGRSSLTVVSSDVTMKADGGSYAGTVSYGDRLVIQDPQGGVFVQVSRMTLDLTGAPAAGGAGMGGLFEGSARLDDYLGITWEDAVAGKLPASPSRSAAYTVAGRWGAYLRGSSADGELLFESVSLASKTGDAEVRDSSWFNRFGSGREQRFRATVEGAVAPGGGGAGGGTGGTGGTGGVGSRTTPFAYVRAGFETDAAAGAPPAVSLESALSARALRDARPKGATELPANSVAIDLDVSGLLLDAKNRASGQRSDSDAGKRAAAVWAAQRKASGLSSSESTTSRVMALLGDATGTVGAMPLRRQVAELADDSSRVTPEVGVMLTEWLAALRAIDEGADSVLGPTAAATAAVRDAKIPRSGDAADGLLADADSPSAPADALEVARFERLEDGDIVLVNKGSRVVGLPGLLPEVLANAPLKDKAPVVSYISGQGRQQIAPASWLAYERADGVTFWLAGADGPVAARDGTLPGWAFTSRKARVVSAGRCGQTLAILRAGAPRPSSGK